MTETTQGFLTELRAERGKWGAVDSDHDLGVSRLSKARKVASPGMARSSGNPQGIHVSEHSPVKIPK